MSHHTSHDQPRRRRTRRRVPTHGNTTSARSRAHSTSLARPRLSGWAYCLSYLQAGGRVTRTYDRVSRAKNRLSNWAALEAANYIWATLIPQLTAHGASRHKTSQVSVSSRRCWIKRRLSYTGLGLSKHAQQGAIGTSRHRVTVSNARRSSSSSLRIKARSSKYWSKARSRHRLGTLLAPFGFSDLWVVRLGFSSDRCCSLSTMS